MPARPVLFAASLEWGLIFVGLVLLWRFVLSPAARASRPAPQLAEWPIALTEFLQFLLVLVCCSLVANLGATLLMKLRPLAGGPRDIFLTACWHAGMLSGIAVFKFLVERVPVAQAAIRVGDVVSGVATLLLALPIVTAVSLAWRWLLGLAGMPLEKQPLVDIFVNAKSPVLLGLMIVLATVTAPVMEEMVFRAGFFRFLRTRVPRWGALLVPAVLFGVMHQNVASFAPLVVLGLIFSLAYERTGRIGTTIVAHGLFNLLAVLLVFAGIGV
jgi:membrane protease YdiL (CAAX protease family)